MGNLASRRRWWPWAGWSARSRLVAILIVVAVSDSGLGLPAAVVYALAFTVEFGAVAGRRTSEGRQRREGRGGSCIALVGLALARARAPPSAEDVRPVGRVQAQGLGADPPRRRSTSRSTGRSSTCSSAPRSRSCSGSALMRWRLATVAGHAADRRRGDLRHRADPGRRDRACRTKAMRALVPVLRDAACSSSSSSTCSGSSRCRSPARPTTASRSGASTRRPRRSR